MILKKLYTLTYFLSYGPMRLYDLFSGTDFSGIDESHEDREHYGFYATPCLSLLLLKGCIHRKLRNGKGRSILDVGCGKGFMLNFFSKLDFDRVAGIECEKDYCRIALRNLKKSGAASHVKLIRADAVSYGGYAAFDTFYLYNPFSRSVLEQCIDGIMSAHKGTSHKNLLLFYCNPVYEDVLAEKGWKEIASFYYKTKVFSFEY